MAAARGVTVADGNDGSLGPTAFVATTLNVYGVSFVSPLMIAVVWAAPTLTCGPPPLAVTV